MLDKDIIWEEGLMKRDLRELIGNYYKAYVKHFASSNQIDCFILA